MNKSKGMSSTLAMKPVINHAKQIITVSEKFFTEASKPFTNEFNDLMKLRELCPGYEITTRSHRKPRNTQKTPNIPKFVSYDKMVAYINLLPNSAELLRHLQLVKDFAACRRNSASIVFNWFNETFPDYRYAPKIDKEGNLVARVNVINLADYKKSVEEKEQARAEAEADPQDTEDTNELKKAV